MKLSDDQRFYTPPRVVIITLFARRSPTLKLPLPTRHCTTVILSFKGQISIDQPAYDKLRASPDGSPKKRDDMTADSTQPRLIPQHYIKSPKNVSFSGFSKGGHYSVVSNKRVVVISMIFGIFPIF